MGITTEIMAFSATGRARPTTGNPFAETGGIDVLDLFAALTGTVSVRNFRPPELARGFPMSPRRQSVNPTFAGAEPSSGMDGCVPSTVDAHELEAFAPAVDLEIDPGIRRAVLILRRAGVETFESCDGGEGHAFKAPTIKFYGNAWAGYKAFAVAMENGLPAARIQQVWHEVDGQLEGPWREIVFSRIPG